MFRVSRRVVGPPVPRRKKTRPFIDSSTETARASSENFRLFSTPSASKTVHPFGNSWQRDRNARARGRFQRVVSFTKQFERFPAEPGSKEDLLSCSVLTQTASMRQEIDCKMPPNYS